MTRLAGIAAVYALIAALLLVTPLSASEDPEPQHAAPIDTVAQSEAAAPETPEPEPTAPEAVAPEAAPPEATAPSDPPATSEPPPPQAPAPAPEPAASTPAAEDPAAPAPRATAAADTSVTISDFQFAPASITIDAGDTVTWINEGPTPHSATADDGSFDTGIQDQGGSASHTFDEAGSFSY
ncbi:MAG TPA: plastocyanin/azurin family copper-binding protein, partial [Thermoleophilaceae bacterium]|nr:plastocyanin/azurin family copper-binding protein [Thermoleophilaceae bacterium]